jgi:hypothetical protein
MPEALERHKRESEYLPPGRDGANKFASLPVGRVSGIGYQSILVAFSKRLDDGLWVVRRTGQMEERSTVSESNLIASSEAEIPWSAWAFSTWRFDELLIRANVGPAFASPANEIPS